MDLYESHPVATADGGVDPAPWGQNDAKSSVAASASIIPAQLSGVDRATALGIVARGYSPVLTLCRLLLEAGHDPSTPLEAWRGDTLCLHVRSIGEAARLCVEDDNIGRPRFRRHRQRRAA
jgi:hypothetical protein